jgi:hypothetical protein
MLFRRSVCSVSPVIDRSPAATENKLAKLVTRPRWRTTLGSGRAATGLPEYVPTGRAGRYHSDDISVGIPVQRAVEDHGSCVSAAVAKIQRVAPHHFTAERLFISRPCLPGLREVLRELRADEFRSGLPVTVSAAAFTSLILPSGPMVMRGSRLASSRLRL